MQNQAAKKKIVILDAYTTNPGDLSWEALETCGELTVHDRTPPEKILERAGDAEIVLTNKARLTADIIERLPKLKLVCLMSTGTNAVDLKACEARGIPVSNVPEYSTASVSELVAAYLLDWSREVSVHFRSVREGEWSRSTDFCYTHTPQRELNGRIMGLVGFGAIGQAVAAMALGLGLRVRVYTPNPHNKPLLGQVHVDMDKLVRTSDFISLHCPLSPETRHLVNEAFIARMKPGAILINTGRGELLDDAVVAEALRSGRLSGAYLDVLTPEPPPADHPLLSAPNCHITPHLGWATREARQRLVDDLLANVNAYLKGDPRNVVNQP
ncbi:MAG: D-2-hydroxyacid dehydrogenase [Verrucomicrobia bacterium]|nr:D-2-hydroxyacid dehydrogenase [Verrucomicrobiota bacterium]MCH8513891.1 D-2-hydroxyacid dehydrogenase [Kiritimatiellia bacterium]